MQDEVKNKPVKVFACGTVKVAICTHSTIVNDEVKEVYSVRFDRSYLDNGQWKHTDSFHTDDLLKVAVVATEAYKYLRLRSYDNDDKDNTGA